MIRYPKLYESTESDFRTNGYGALSDAQQCLVTNEINGRYELELTYPIDGIHMKRLVSRAIICAEASPKEGIQPFRINAVTKMSPGTVKVYARHISYDLGGVPVSPFTASASGQAIAMIKKNSAIDHPFVLKDLIGKLGDMNSSEPRSVRSCLLDEKDSIVSTYGGEFRFNKYDVEFRQRLGGDHGYRIKYGVNLIDLTEEQNGAAVYTGIYPFYKGRDFGSEGDTVVELEEKILNVEGVNFNFTQILPVDLSHYFEEVPTEGQLRAVALEYLEKNNVSAPKTDLTLTYEQLSRSAEYSNIVLPEEIELGDSVLVEYPRLGISSSARVYSTVYDPLLQKYKWISVGDVSHTLVTTMLQLKRKSQSVVNESQAALYSLAALIAKGAITISMISGPENGGLGELSGEWVAKPATGSSTEPSRIITQQDLKNYGLIQ